MKVRNAMMKTERENAIIQRFAKFVPDGNYSRLGTTFETAHKKYFFDTGTGKVFDCEEEEYEAFKQLFEHNSIAEVLNNNIGNSNMCNAYEKILDMIEKEHILQASKCKNFVQLSEENLKILVEQDLQQVILELTEKCNLRCKYCIYNEYNPAYRNFTTRDMEWDVAKRAIDYTCEHSGKKIAVTFYGGEPLVKFDLMKKCIEYSKSIMSDRDLTFSFSTNLTLMTREIARYVASVDGCSVLCSLDGPKVIQDSYRVKADGTGTFDQALQGLQNLVEEMGESAKDRIIINTVVCPPYTKEKLDMIQTFFDDLDWLPKEVDKKCDYVEGGTIREEDIAVDFLNGKNIAEKYQKNELDSIRSWALDNVLNNDDKKGYASGINKNNLIKIHNRILTDIPNIRFRRNGCCIPGNRRIYVQVDGDFLVCEKIGDSPTIGNVFTGIDIKKIRKYFMEEYDQKSMKQCSKCWAINLCGICYASCFVKKGIDINIKNKACEYQRNQAKGELMAYYQLLEEKPDEIEKIKDIPIM